MSMSLTGGIDMYSFDGERSGSNVSPEGRKVVYLNKNGYDMERDRANKHFKEGQILTIKEIYVGRSSSEVEFIELPDNRFNTVMFDDVKE